MGSLTYSQYSVRTSAVLVEAYRLFCSTSSLNVVFSLNGGTWKLSCSMQKVLLNACFLLNIIDERTGNDQNSNAATRDNDQRRQYVRLG
jgi:hypothetical protein